MNLMALTKNKKYNICQEQKGKNGHITKSATAIVRREWEMGGKVRGRDRIVTDREKVKVECDEMRRR